MSGLELMARASCVLLHTAPVLSQWAIPICRSASPREGSSPAMTGPAPSHLEIKELEIKLLPLPLFKCQGHLPSPACHPSSKGIGAGVLAPAASSATVTQPKSPFILVVSSRGPRVPLVDLA